MANANSPANSLANASANSPGQRHRFELQVLQQGESCMALLLWNHRAQHLSVALPESAQVTQQYGLWQSRYFRFYELALGTPLSRSGRLNPGTGDPAHDLMEAEQALLQAFRRWLGEGNGRIIQQKIRDRLMGLIQQAGESDRPQTVGIDLLITCDSPLLARLPWEQWDLVPEGVSKDAIRIFRSAPQANALGPRQTRQTRQTRSRKPRILAILADDPTLNVQADWQLLRSLRHGATVERLTWPPEIDSATLKTQLTTLLKDDRGWDVLYFGGHSDDTAASGGKFALSASHYLAISDLEDALAQAHHQGLQLAIFNSCNGLTIAQSLAALGLQAVVMREPIASSAAHSLLQPFCQRLAQGEDVGAALAAARQTLATHEKFAHPSAHLVPSLFLPTGAMPYRLQSPDWRQYGQQWLPTRKELVWAVLITLMALIYDIRIGILLDTRLLLQAVYRHYTGQHPQPALTSPPPVAVISVDQASLNQARERISEFQFADPHEIDREYLSGLVSKLSSFGAKTIGISYLLYTEEPKEALLAEAVQTAVAQGTWFVFASDVDNDLYGRDAIASVNWSFQGDQDFSLWQLDLPQNGQLCTQDCPFSYLLAMAAAIDTHPPFQQQFQPHPERNQSLQQELNFHLRTWQQSAETAVGQLTHWLQQARHRAYMIDTSLPPPQIYETIPAHELLNTAFHDDYFAQRVVIIAPGDYSAEDDFMWVPLGHDFHQCYLSRQWCREHITRGELQAYSVHHLLTQYRPWRVSDIWVLSLAMVLAKALAIRITCVEQGQRRKYLYRLAAASVTYALAMVQLFVSTGILVPIALPLLAIWLWVLGSYTLYLPNQGKNIKFFK